MKKSKAETAETRSRIVEVAAGEFRAKGIHATGLADVMAAAGLSHGGFYRHFDSKDHLVAEASAAALTRIIGELDAVAEGSDAADKFKAVVDAYMSTTHRDSPASGCPLAGMGSELARADEGTRAATSHGIDEFVEMLARRRIGKPDDGADRSRAVFALAALVGALTLSRILPDEDASAALLEDVRQHIEMI